MCMLIQPCSPYINPFWLQEVIFIDKINESSKAQIYLTLAVENVAYDGDTSGKEEFGELRFLHRGYIRELIDQSDSIRAGNEHWLQKLTNPILSRSMDVKGNVVTLNHTIKRAEDRKYQPYSGYPIGDVTIMNLPDVASLRLWPNDDFKRDYFKRDELPLFTTFCLDKIIPGTSIYRFFFETEIGIREFISKKKIYFRIPGPAYVKKRLEIDIGRLRPEIFPYFRSKFLFFLRDHAVQYDVIIVEPVSRESSIESGFPYKQETEIISWCRPNEVTSQHMQRDCIARIFTPYVDDFSVATVSEYSEEEKSAG